MTDNDSSILPKHVVIIPDGNRRWAKKRGLAPIAGHKRGLDAALKVVKASRNLGIKVLTIWGFSTENWRRPDREVGYLMKIYLMFFKKHMQKLFRRGITF